MSDIVVDLRIMSEELLRAASVIESQRAIMKELKSKLDVCLGEEKVSEKKPAEVKTEELAEPVKETRKGTPHKNHKQPKTEAQLNELYELAQKPSLNPQEYRRYTNLRYMLRHKGVQDLPERSLLNKAEKDEEIVKVKRKALTLSDEIKPEPEEGEVLWNCFKEVKPGYWERDGIDLVLQDAKDTIKDLKAEGFRAVMQPASQGYKYMGNK